MYYIDITQKKKKKKKLKIKKTLSFTIFLYEFSYFEIVA